MSFTKRQIINKAFSKMGLAAYAYDLEPEELQSALVELDAMMAEWSDEGVQVGWPLTTSPENADLDAETGLQSGAVATVFNMLACRLAPEFGKQVPQMVTAAAISGYKLLQGRLTSPPVIKAQLTPAGQGHPLSRINRGSYRSNYLPQAKDRRARGLENEEVTFKKG